MDRRALLLGLMRTGERGEVDAAVFQTLRIDHQAGRIDAGDIGSAPRDIHLLDRHLALRERDRPASLLPRAASLSDCRSSCVSVTMTAAGDFDQFAPTFALADSAPSTTCAAVAVSRYGCSKRQLQRLQIELCAGGLRDEAERAGHAERAAARP